MRLLCDYKVSGNNLIFVILFKTSKSRSKIKFLKYLHLCECQITLYYKKAYSQCNIWKEIIKNIICMIVYKLIKKRRNTQTSQPHY